MEGSAECIAGLGGSMLAIAADTGQVERLRRVLEKYVHRLRNRLNCMKMSLYLAKRTELGDRIAGWAELEERYRTLEQFMDQLQRFCSETNLQPVRASLETFIREHREPWLRCLSARGRRMELVPPKDPAVGQFDPSRLGECLDTLAQWRSQVGPPETLVRVSWWAGKHDLNLVWEEPGVLLSEGPSRRGDDPVSLALPMLARVMAAHRGTLEVALRGEVRLGLRWPIDLS